MRVYIVHCVDTEGPMNETLEATFSRIRNIFNVSIDPTEDNLRKLQRSEIPLGGMETAIANLVSANRLEMKNNWFDIEKMLLKLNEPSFRFALGNDEGRPWIFTWFCLDHVGFTGANPRQRDIGDHKVFDYYRHWVGNNTWGDAIQWHYHPLPITGNVNDSGISYLTSNNIWEILSKKIIQRNWFPSAYRPGFHTVRPDSHWFLEQWIPFDYGNQSTLVDDVDQPDLADGRYGDWRRSPNNWDIYHPSHDDYQSRGNCRRWIARCLNVEARLRKLTDDDIESAFTRAVSGVETVMAMTNHDFRDIHDETLPIIDRIKSVMKRYPQVEVIPIDAVNAMRKALSLETSRLVVNCNLEKITSAMMILTVSVEGDMFGTQPYLAIELDNSKYIWENFDYKNRNCWRFVFDSNHIPAERVTAIGVAANSSSGNTAIANLRVGQGVWCYSHLD